MKACFNIQWHEFLTYTCMDAWILAVAESPVFRDEIKISPRI